MESKKYREGIKGIFLRLDYLVSMASIKDIDIDALFIELDDINKKIKHIDSEIKAYTPSDVDINNAKNKDQISLTSKNSQLTDINGKLKTVEETMADKKDELLTLTAEEDRLKKEVEDVTDQLHVFQEYKMKSREFNLFITDNKQTIDKINSLLNEIKTKKGHVQNAINLLNDERNDLNNKKENIQEEISSLEYNLSSDKSYRSSKLFQDKNKIRESFTKQKEELEERKRQIEQDPAYIAKTIKDAIENKKDLDYIKSLLNNLCAIVLKQPYMKKVIRNQDDITQLEKEYRQLQRQYNSLDKKIKNTDYSLEKLPIEEARRLSNEKLINLKKDQIEQHKEILKNNEVAIKTLASQVVDLKASYAKRCLDVEKFENSINNIKESNIQANRKTELEKMHQLLDEEQTKINAWQKDIRILIKANIEEKRIIDVLEKEIDALSKETTSILNQQMARHNYKDVINLNKDAEELEKIGKQIAYLKKRLEYQNYNVSQLKSEITNALKRIFGTKKEETVSKNSPSITISSEGNIELTPLADLLNETKNKEIISKEDVSKSIESFENMLDNFFPNANNKTTEQNFDVLDNLVQYDLSKVEGKQPEDKKPAASKLKVVAIDSLVKDKEKTSILKVIAVEPRVKKMQENSADLTKDDIFNMVYNPFSPESIQASQLKVK